MWVQVVSLAGMEAEPVSFTAASPAPGAMHGIRQMLSRLCRSHEWVPPPPAEKQARSLEPLTDR